MLAHSSTGSSRSLYKPQGLPGDIFSARTEPGAYLHTAVAVSFLASEGLSPALRALIHTALPFSTTFFISSSIDFLFTHQQNLPGFFSIKFSRSWSFFISSYFVL